MAKNARIEFQQKTKEYKKMAASHGRGVKRSGDILEELAKIPLNDLALLAEHYRVHTPSEIAIRILARSGTTMNKTGRMNGDEDMDLEFEDLPDLNLNQILRESLERHVHLNILNDVDANMEELANKTRDELTKMCKEKSIWKACQQFGNNLDKYRRAIALATVGKDINLNAKCKDYRLQSQCGKINRKPKAKYPPIIKALEKMELFYDAEKRIRYRIGQLVNIRNSPADIFDKLDMLGLPPLEVENVATDLILAGVIPPANSIWAALYDNYANLTYMKELYNAIAQRIKLTDAEAKRARKDKDTVQPSDMPTKKEKLERIRDVLENMDPDLLRLQPMDPDEPDLPVLPYTTPLHAAILHPEDDLKQEVIKLLLRYGANPNIMTVNLGTPLHEAYRLGNEDIIQLLLNNGARPMQDRFNKIPADYVDIAADIGGLDLEDTDVKDLIGDMDIMDIKESSEKPLTPAEKLELRIQERIEREIAESGIGERIFDEGERIFDEGEEVEAIDGGEFSDDEDNEFSDDE